MRFKNHNLTIWAHSHKAKRFQTGTKTPLKQSASATSNKEQAGRQVDPERDGILKFGARNKYPRRIFAQPFRWCVQKDEAYLSCPRIRPPERWIMGKTPKHTNFRRSLRISVCLYGFFQSLSFDWVETFCSAFSYEMI